MIVNRNKLFYECGEGWNRIIEECLDKIEMYPDCEINVLQIKEKYGGLRIYIGMGIEEILNLIDYYEGLSLHICENCGEFYTAKMRERSGWYKTLCDKCTNTLNWRDNNGSN